MSFSGCERVCQFLSALCSSLKRRWSAGLACFILLTAFVLSFTLENGDSTTLVVLRCLA